MPKNFLQDDCGICINCSAHPPAALLWNLLLFRPNYHAAAAAAVVQKSWSSHNHDPNRNLFLGAAFLPDNCGLWLSARTLFRHFEELAVGAKSFFHKYIFKLGQISLIFWTNKSAISSKPLNTFLRLSVRLRSRSHVSSLPLEVHLQIAQCICPNYQMYLSKLSYVKYICKIFKMWFSKCSPPAYR